MSLMFVVLMSLFGVDVLVSFLVQNFLFQIFEQSEPNEPTSSRGITE